MKIIKNKNYKKVLLPLIIVGILLVGYVIVAYLTNLWPFQSEIDPNSRRQETSSQSSKNDNPITKEGSKASVNEGKDTAEVPVSTEVKASITKLEQNGDQITFSAKIDNSENGTCVVTFSNANDRPIVKQFDSTTKGDVTLCESTFSSFEFSYIGEWDVSLRYYIGAEQALAQGKITIK
jgi:cytoskeletal protein RodZ